MKRPNVIKGLRGGRGSNDSMDQYFDKAKKKSDRDLMRWIWKTERPKPAPRRQPPNAPLQRQHESVDHASTMNVTSETRKSESIAPAIVLLAGIGLSFYFLGFVKTIGCLVAIGLFAWAVDAYKQR
jgi:hypothetical protein